MTFFPALLLALLLNVNSFSAAAPAQAESAPASAAPTAKQAREAARSNKEKKAKQASKATRAAKAALARERARKVDYKGEQVNFVEWQSVQVFADEMAQKHGFARAELATLIEQVRHIDSAVQLVKPGPPGKPKNWHAVRKLFVEPIRIKAGAAFWNTHAATLARAEAQFGVPAEIIVGIIGVETVYGRNTGNFRVLDVLTTLAFAYPEAPNRSKRMDFFRGELENTLLLARKNGIDPFSLRGSFAGAIGMPQFMPGSILAYGIDFDGDGAVDLRNSAVDAIGSVANFLVEHGWQRGQEGPIAYPADVSDGRAWEGFIGQGLAAKIEQESLMLAGVRSASKLPQGMKFGLIDLQNGDEPTEYWLATDNFFAITHYNRSYFYAMSVVELGRAVRDSGRVRAAVATL